MHRNVISVSAAASALILAAMLSACSSGAATTAGESEPFTDCGALLGSVVERNRIGDTHGAINAEMDALSASCPDEYDIATDYFSVLIEASNKGPELCDSWGDYALRPEAIELLAADGMCSRESQKTPDELWPEGALGWDEASDYVGDIQLVCGPLATVRGDAQGVFVNVGKDYPDPQRFAFVIWGEWWLDPIEAGATVCASGPIHLYNGVAQMELVHPSELKVW
ncbi:hypothetical protein [Leucobacter sp. Psy1]|uniref:hypothetical protein n=1 Tax=Leucobacter sp. Psy1 TaxID=2875729 RepID=UPI001CD4C2E3|nr:hypothetical protein [Leucobacter sp. Psy1]